MRFDNLDLRIKHGFPVFQSIDLQFLLIPDNDLALLNEGLFESLQSLIFIDLLDAIKYIVLILAASRTFLLQQRVVILKDEGVPETAKDFPILWELCEYGLEIRIGDDEQIAHRIRFEDVLHGNVAEKAFDVKDVPLLVGLDRTDLLLGSGGVPITIYGPTL